MSDQPTQIDAFLAEAPFPTFAQFFELVRDMRRAQSDYFIQRTRENLIRAKQLEAEVDRVIREWFQMQSTEESHAISKY